MSIVRLESIIDFARVHKFSNQENDKMSKKPHPVTQMGLEKKRGWAKGPKCILQHIWA